MEDCSSSIVVRFLQWSKRCLIFPNGSHKNALDQIPENETSNTWTNKVQCVQHTDCSQQTRVPPARCTHRLARVLTLSNSLCIWCTMQQYLHVTVSHPGHLYFAAATWQQAHIPILPIAEVARCLSGDSCSALVSISQGRCVSVSMMSSCCNISIRRGSRFIYPQLQRGQGGEKTTTTTVALSFLLKHFREGLQWKTKMWSCQFDSTITTKAWNTLLLG